MAMWAQENQILEEGENEEMIDPKEDRIIWNIAADITTLTGILFGKKHTSLIRNRLTKRIRELGLNSVTDYEIYLEKNRKVETSVLISLLTTNHTFFFREFDQFTYMRDHSLPHVVAELRKEKRKTLRVWSAACSFGQEVYSLAMFLDYHLKKLAPEMDFRIVGSDISEEAVQKAKDGVYRWSDLRKTPALYLANHWTKVSGQKNEMVRANDHLRSRCEFELINLQTLSDQSSKAKFDYILCRNVFIYFSRENICEISSKLSKRLEPHGLFFVGLSESLQGMNLPLERVGKSTYRLVGQAGKATKPVADATMPPVEKRQAIIRVLCVDDSETVLGLLKNILSEKAGFKIVGTAKDGLEATEFLKNNEVDVVTLDIHMPNQNGVEFLESHKGKKIPSVVIVSSVSRDDAKLAIKALEFGADDYVEKPTLKNFALKGDEIRAKVKSSFLAKQSHETIRHDLDEKYRVKVQITEPEKKLRVIVGKPGDRVKYEWVVSQLEGPQPATVVLIEGLANLDEAFAESLGGKSKMPVRLLGDEVSQLSSSTVYLGQLDDKSYQRLGALHRSRVCQILLSPLSKNSEKTILSLKGAYILADEQASRNSIGSGIDFQKDVGDVAPYTSLAYESEKYFENVADSAEKEKEAKDNIDAFVKSMPQSANESLGKPRKAPVDSAASHDKIGVQYFVIGSKDLLVCFYEPLSKFAKPFLLKGRDSKTILSEVESSCKSFRSNPNLISKQVEMKVIKGRDVGSIDFSSALKNQILLKGDFRGKTDRIDAYVYTDSGRIRVSNVIQEPVKPPAVRPLTGELGRFSTEKSSPRPEHVHAPAPAKVTVERNGDQKIRVLVVDDSEPIRILLKKMLRMDPRMDVVGEASKPSEVDGLIQSLNPDVMTLDIHMPEMTGTQLLEKIYPKYKIPTIIVTSLSAEEGNDVLRALEIGAFDYIQKPSFDKMKEVAIKLCEQVHLASLQPRQKRMAVGSRESHVFDPRRPIVIGSSTGGVEALRDLIALFPKEIPPVLIVQHIPAFFSKAFADRLNELYPFEIKEAKTGDILVRNRILIAPGGRQMYVQNRNGLSETLVDEGPGDLLHKPSVDLLFQSVAKDLGKRAIGIILTGMGSDGAQGLKTMREAGCYTIGQSEQSCVVYGMPKAAKLMGAVCKEVPLEQIPRVISEASRSSDKKKGSNEAA